MKILSKRFFKRSLMVFIIGGLVAVLSVWGINWWVLRAGSGRVFYDVADVPEAPVALVLGTSKYVRSGRKNIFFSNRIRAAVELYQSGKVKKLIVSGDNGSTGYNETEDMRQELIERGIPAKDIVNDHAGFRTLDSVVRANSVFGQKKFVVVSQEFHIRRAIFIADAHDLNATGYVAADPNMTAATRQVHFREILARVKAFLDVHILGTKPRFPGPYEPIRFDD